MRNNLYLFIIIVILFSSFGCSDSAVNEAYRHLKIAREHYDSGVIYIKKDHRHALMEYEKAFSISIKEFKPADYYHMADLYLEVNNDLQKYDEFIKKGNELKNKMGNTTLGPALFKRLLSE